MKSFKEIAAVAVIGLLSVHSSAQAAEQRVAVRVAGYELTTEAGIQAVYSRIVKAARNVCGEREQTGSRLVSPEWQKCVRDTVASAVTKVASQKLYAYHVTKSPRPTAAAT
jgi:UrcA family protein